MRNSHAVVPHEVLSVRLPSALLDSVRLRVIARGGYPARSGCVSPYGMMRQTVLEALTLWLEQTK